MMTSTILNNKTVAKSLRRLQAMGLKCTVEQINNDWIFVACTEESIIDTIKRIVDKSITYPKHHVVYDKSTGMLVIHFWRGDRPLAITLGEFRGDGQ